MPQIRADYKQVFLLPPAIDDWIGPDHPARFIGDFVDSLDLEVLGFRVPNGETGRPPYSTRSFVEGMALRLFQQNQVIAQA